MAEHKNVTLHDVAERAGVSYQTVSRALNNSGFVSAKTRARIDEAVAALHYVPNLMARQLSSRESKLAGFISINTSFQMPGFITDRLRSLLLQQGWDLFTVSCASTSPETLQDAIRQMRSRQIRKIVSFIPCSAGYARSLVQDNPELELLFLDVSPAPDLFSVLIDPRPGLSEAVAELVLYGHSSIAVITGEQGMYSADSRLQAIYEAAAAQHVNIAAVASGDWSARSGFECMHKLLHQSNKFTAVICASDQKALGALSALHESGLSVPRDMSVIGYNNSADSAFYTPALTTVNVDWSLLCEEIARRLLSDGPKESVVLPTALLRRASVALCQSSEGSLQELTLQLQGIVHKLQALQD